MFFEFRKTFEFWGIVHHDNLIFQIFRAMFQDTFYQLNGELFKVVVDDDDGDLENNPIYEKYLRDI